MKKSVISLEDGHFIIVYTYMITYECLKEKQMAHNKINREAFRKQCEFTFHTNFKIKL